jgi:hypothetical protein
MPIPCLRVFFRKFEGHVWIVLCIYNIVHAYVFLHNIIYNIRACAQAGGRKKWRYTIVLGGRGGDRKVALASVRGGGGGGVKNPPPKVLTLANIWMAPCEIVVVNPSLHKCTRFIYSCVYKYLGSRHYYEVQPSPPPAPLATCVCVHDPSNPTPLHCVCIDLYTCIHMHAYGLE